MCLFYSGTSYKHFRVQFNAKQSSKTKLSLIRNIYVVRRLLGFRCLAQSVDLGVSGFIYLFWYENSRYCFEKCLKEDCRLLTYLDCLIYKHNFSLYIKWSRLSGFPMVLTIGKPRNQETTSGNEQKKYLSIFVYSSVVRVWVFFTSEAPFPAK